VQEGEAFAIEVLPILCKPSTAVEPRNGALDNPTLGQMHKSFGLMRTLDDLGGDGGQDVGQRLLELSSLVTSVSEQRLQKGISAEQGRQ